ncbi:MAG: EamA family transporter [Deltaproteobacteria bacterium]|nr:EamA family transporter [Deltaproteobacteria bacterium]
MAGTAMVVLAAASWGTWSLFLRPTGLSSFVTSPILFAVMGLGALPWALAQGRVAWDRTTVALLLANALCDALNVVAFFGALATTTVALAVLTHYAAPILIALAAARVDGIRTRGAGAAAAVALAGLVVVLEPWAPRPGEGATLGSPLLGALLGLASAFAYAANTFVVRRLAERIGAVRAMSYHSLVAAALLAPLAVLAPAGGGLGDITGGDLALLVAGAATIGMVSGIAFVHGLVRIGAARAAVLTFAEPLVAVAVGALVWEEPLHPIAALGGALVLGAGIHVAREAR